MAFDFGKFLVDAGRTGLDLATGGLASDLIEGKGAGTTAAGAVKGLVGGVADVFTPPPNTFQATAPTSGFQQGQIPINQMNLDPAMQQALGQVGGNQLNLADAVARGQQQQMQGFDMASQAGAGQSSLADALRAQMPGQGPSLAQLQLQGATDRNQQMAAGALAGQRGINPALAARMIGQQSAGMNQQAAGQSAQIRMQEQLAAQQQLANVLAQQRQGALGQAGAGQDLFGTSGQLTLGQQGQNTQMVGTLGNLQQGQNALQVEEALGRGKLNLAAAQGDQQAEIDAQRINSGVAEQNAAAKAAAFKGVTDAAGKAVSTFAGMSEGGRVPGKAKVAGDSDENDTVPTMLSPGEVVLPRTVADDPEQAADFVAELLGKKKKKPKGSYADVLAKLAEIESMIGGADRE